MLDVIARGKGASGNEVVFWKNNGGFSNCERNSVSTAEGEGLSHGDVDGDGFIDLISTDRWHRNPGPPIATNAWNTYRFTSSFGGTDVAIDTGDFNNDGRLDIVQSNSEPPGTDAVSWFEAPVDPTSTNWTQHQIDVLSETVHSIRVADFNNDGIDDLVCAEMHQSVDPDEVNVYINQGDGDAWNKIPLSSSG